MRLTWTFVSIVRQQLGTAQVRIGLANPKQILKLGMYVNIAFTTQSSSAGTKPLLPSSAIQNIGNQQIVFVATNNPNSFLLRPVRLQSAGGDYYLVLDGITSGERIVTDGSFMLRAEWLKFHSGQ
ncbi:MAG: efflux RND transporter periplasmic adaptor subunit [Pyrinomonadaceae bacterium]